MATAMQSLQVTSALAAPRAEVFTSSARPTSLRCGWKRLGSAGRGFSPLVPSTSSRDQLRIAPVAPRSALGGGGSGVTPQLKESVEKFLNEHKVVLFMKGDRKFPQCGFSNTCVQILNSLRVPYETVNILENENLRQGMKLYSSWPTFPQLYIDGEFFGGCDITLEAYQSGELKEMLEKAMLS